MGMLDMKITQDMLDYWKKVIPASQFIYYALDDSFEGTLYHPTIQVIEHASFQSCSKLTSINLPSATTIGQHTFGSCGTLTSVNLPMVTSIGQYAFSYCNLTSVNLPSATTIEYGSFDSCRNLTSVELLAVITIGSSAFSSCSNLTTVTLGSNLTSIGSGAFSSCPKLAEINIYAPKSQVTTAAQAPWNAPSTCQVNWLGGE